jgi:hypothetical protein
MYRVGSWSLARVEVRNTGAPFAGRLAVSADGPDGAPIDAVVPLTLAKGTAKRLLVPVRPYTSQYRFPVRLLGPSGREVFKATANGRPADPEILIGVVTSAARPGLSISDADARRIEVAYLEGADLAETPLAYDALDALVVAEPLAEAANPVEAGEALRRWVAGGRTAVVMAGDAGPSLAGGPFAWALPAPIPGSIDADDFTGVRDALARGAEAPARRKAALADLRGQSGRVLAVSAGLPMAVERPVGLGRAILVAPDLQAVPFLGWKGTPRVWDALLRLPPKTDGEPELLTHSSGRDPLQGAFEALRFLVPISIGFILLFLVLYILAVGPGDYFLLRRIGRRFGLTWITVPLWSLLFCGVLYAVTAYKRSGDLTVRAATVVDVIPGERDARGVTYVGVFAPAADRFDFRVEAESGIASPRGVGEGIGAISLGGQGGWFEAGGGTVFSGMPIASGVMRTAEAEWWVAAASFREGSKPMYDVAVERPAGGGMRIVNRGTRTFEEARLVEADGGVRELGTLKPGEPVDVRAPARAVGALMDALPVFDSSNEIYYVEPGSDAATSGEDQRFVTGARRALLWYTLYGLMEARSKQGGYEMQSRLLQQFDVRTRRRLDLSGRLEGSKGLLIGYDAGVAPVAAGVNGGIRPRPEVVMVRIWVAQ